MIIKKILKDKIIFLLIFIGAILRFCKFSEVFSWGSEHSFSLLPIARLFEEKKLTLIGLNLFNAKSGLFLPPFFTYIFALPLKLFKLNPLGLGIIFAIFGLINIFLIFLSAKKIFDRTTAIIAAGFYTLSLAIIDYDRTVWVITPLIIVSSLVLCLLNIIFNSNKHQSLPILITGMLVGLGFSFHPQATIIFLSLITLLLITKKFKKAFLFIIGTMIFLSPLIIFNLRHNFIMFKGLHNLLFGKEVLVRSSSTLLGKLNNDLGAFSDLSLQILNLPFVKPHLLINCLIFLLFFLLPAFYVYKYSKLAIQRLITIYFLFSCLLALIGLVIVDQGFYSSTAIYLWFLIPLLLIIWARVLTLLINTKLKVGVIMVLILFIIANLYSIFNQKPTDYQQKIAIVNYVLKEAKGKKFSLKFINKDALIYDYLFYYRAPFYNLSFFKDINIIEQWQDGKPDFFIIHGSYDWKEDKYRILPSKKIADFNGIKIVIKPALFE